ncbi:hypothetical protein CPAV1605_910 [seawater metagenome]|uniref:Uncharacterized protein n=1 Tax=seawater metagenome TaxID=1561972 RepID=A0A5E8CLQ3_9ZZZZ
MESQQIKKTVEEIVSFINNKDNKNLQNSNKELLKYKVETNFTEFNELYPTLIKKILNGDKLDYLDKMLSAMSQIKENKISQFEAEKKLGEELAEEYVYPIVDKNKK